MNPMYHHTLLAMYHHGGPDALRLLASGLHAAVIFPVLVIALLAGAGLRASRR